MKLQVYQNVLNRLGAIIYDSEFRLHVYSVGGCERDRLLGNDIKDIDLVVDIENGGIKLANWLYENGYLQYAPVTYENYGTAMFHLKDFPDIELEAVQTRKESYRDMTTRNPETAYGTIQEDCKRRDFTMNALYRTIGTDELHDFTGRSLQDIDAQIIRSCDNPDIIFKEDPLRILRAIRFSCRLGWKIEEETYDKMEKNSYRLEIISQERITDEFNKIVTSRNAESGLRTMRSINALKFVSPQLGSLSNEEFEWALSSMRLINTMGYGDTSLEQRVAILFMKTTLPEIAMREMKYSNDLIKTIMTIIREVPIVQGLGDKYYTINPVEVRRQQYRIGDSELHAKIVMVAHSINNRDCLAIRKNMQAIHVMSWLIRLLREGQDCYRYKLPVDGEDVMKLKGIGPCRAIKKYLDYLLETAFTNPRISRDDCIALLSKVNFE